MRALAIFLLISVSCSGQVYPHWFLEPLELNCGFTSAGYARSYYNESSSDSAALFSACKNMALEHYVKIKGGEGYWGTESGVYWMGNDITETIDTIYFRNLFSSTHQIARYENSAITIVLLSFDSCSVPQSALKVDTCSPRQPDWVESLPQDRDYIYAEGVAPTYFYESSSWETAERRARLNLARSVKVNLKSLQKLEDRSGQDIRNEDVTAELRNVQVVHRWVDAKRGLYYVLLRMQNK